jgi:hypothetical protein
MPDPTAPAERQPERSVPQGRVSALLHEIRNHPFGYGVMLAFLIAGPLLATYLFPEAPTGLAAIGGFALGAYAALCAVPGKFL